MSYSLLSDAVSQSMRQQIMAEEDKKVFEALDNAASSCDDRSHAWYGKHVRNCPEPECAARWVHES